MIVELILVLADKHYSGHTEGKIVWVKTAMVSKLISHPLKLKFRPVQMHNNNLNTTIIRYFK